MDCGDSPDPSELCLDRVARPSRIGLGLPKQLSFRTWERVGGQIALITDASGWWLGDWLVYGEEHFADRYRVAASSSALDYQTLKNYAWVARKIPMSRRRAALSLQHHAEVAAMPADQQDVWLDRAEVSRWSKSELRRQIRRSRLSDSSAREVTELTIQLIVGTERQARWEEAAAIVNCSLSDWMAVALDQAADAVRKSTPGDRLVEVDGPGDRVPHLTPVAQRNEPGELFAG